MRVSHPFKDLRREHGNMERQHKSRKALSNSKSVKTEVGI